MPRDIPPSVPECSFSMEKSQLKHYELKRTLIISYDPKIKIVSIGEENDLETKNIFLMGGTGAGKTCLLNALVNHLLGIDFEDNYRYVLKDEIGDNEKGKAESQTEFVTGYLIFVPSYAKRNCNYFIIDTPGLNDTRRREGEVLDQIRTFLKDVDGVEELHCIGFVVNGTTTRIQRQFKDVVDEFCRMFGENAKDAIRVLISFGYMKQPPVLNVLESSFLKDSKTCKVDNASLYSPNKPDDIHSEEDILMSRYMWNKASKAYDKFLDDVDSVKAVCLGLTREALNEISILYKIMNSLKEVVNSYVSVQVEIKQLESKCKEYELVMKANEAWEGTVQIKVRKITKEISSWLAKRLHAHNCETCLQTCKYPCKHFPRSRCPGPGGVCESCHCPNENHVRSNELISPSIENRTVIYEDKKNLYDDSEAKNIDLQKEILVLRKDSISICLHIDREVENINYHSNQLKQNSLSHKDFILQDLLSQTFQQIRFEYISQSSKTQDHTLVSSILEDLNMHISTLLGS